MESSEAGPEEIEEVTPRPKGTKKREDLHEDETDVSTDKESEFKTPRTLKKQHSRKSFVVYSTESEPEVEAGQRRLRRDKGKERKKELEVNLKSTCSSKKVRTYNRSLATGGRQLRP